MILDLYLFAFNNVADRRFQRSYKTPVFIRQNADFRQNENTHIHLFIERLI